MAKVSELWTHLSKMESQARFQEQPYPVDRCSFPFQLTGQGFFPGGDGLWRDDEGLQKASTGALPVNGVMFIANDFGTLPTYMRLQRSSYENPPTWRHLKQRVIAAQIPHELCFCTNAVMGLKSAGKALDKSVLDEGFMKFCREFLHVQVATLQPKLIVALGPVAAGTLQSMSSPSSSGTIKLGERLVTLLVTTHPYADFGFTRERREQEYRRLREAWALSLAS